MRMVLRGALDNHFQVTLTHAKPSSSSSGYQNSLNNVTMSSPFKSVSRRAPESLTAVSWKCGLLGSILWISSIICTWGKKIIIIIKLKLVYCYRHKGASYIVKIENIWLFCLFAGVLYRHNPPASSEKPDNVVLSDPAGK